MTHSSTSSCKVLRHGRWRSQFIVAPVAVALAMFFWHVTEVEDRSLGFWVAIVFFGALTVFSLLPSDTIFDRDRRDIERRWSLFGVIPIFRRRLFLGEFRRVCWRHLPGIEPGDWHTWMVGLERNSGRPVYLNYFYVTRDGTCHEAQQFAMELSKLTGLPLNDDIRTA